jgi:hypothetical protein
LGIFFDISHHTRCAIAHVCGKYYFYSKEQEERRVAGRGVWCRSQTPEDRRQFLDPSACCAFEGSKESLLQAGADKPIGFLDLPVGFVVCHRCILDLDA